MLLSSLLPLLALVLAESYEEHLEDQAIAAQLIAEDLESLQHPIAPPAGYRDNDVPSKPNFTRSVWDCDVRSWVRAPDLSPGATVPADVRLAMNGSACSDVVGWKVGLSLSERGIMKVKAPGAVFPVEPVWRGGRDRRDQYGIFELPGALEDNVFDTQWTIYQKALQNPDLWFAKAAEREAFDAQLDMPALPNPRDVDTVVPFFAHCPNTNLPPMILNPQGLWEPEPDNDFIGTELAFHYRVILHLANGSTVEQSAGQAGFAPAPVDLGKTQTVVTNKRLTTRRPVSKEEEEVEEESDEDGRYDPAPACDKGKLARFNVTVATDPVAVQGTNHTFNLTITRSGTGSEYPASLDLSLGVYANVTWALSYISAETYETSTWSTGVQGYASAFRMTRGQSMHPRILAAKTETELREELEAQTSELSVYPGAGDVAAGVTRVELEGNREEYEMSVEIPIPENMFPSSNRTFLSIVPTLDLRLNTYFTCDASDDPSNGPFERFSSGEWQEYMLPPPPEVIKKRRDAWRHSTTWHDGRVAFDVVIAPRSDLSSGPGVVDYTHPSARAPILTLSSDTPEPADFPLLSQEIKEEAPEEMQRFKYRVLSLRSNTLLCQSKREGAYDRACWARDLDAGGVGRHTAKVWQRKERREREGSKSSQ